MRDDTESPWAGGQVRGEGLILRPWDLADVPRMVRLFNTTEMDRWTPLAHPFDEDAAVAYVHGADRGRAAGLLQLAVTLDGQEPLGEVLLFGTEEPGTCELAYAVGHEHRGRALGARSVRAVLPVARAAGYADARLRIAEGNLASARVAAAAGFTLTDEPLLPRERKGYVLSMATWRCHLSEAREFASIRELSQPPALSAPRERFRQLQVPQPPEPAPGHLIGEKGRTPARRPPDDPHVCRGRGHCDPEGR